MRFRSFAVLLGIAALLAPNAAKTGTIPAQEPRYDPETVVTLSATVLELREVPKGGILSGLHLIVDTDKDSDLDVYIAPMHYLKELQISYAKGDRLEIKGSKVKTTAGTVVLVREVRRDADTGYFRDAGGKPYWNPGS
ncbi:MAG TPA: hypothetical protein VKU19_33110 [Bryobacteraceae bacterium]|nr:hypothetical protein [Bryobacteraceae bacterium]